MELDPLERDVIGCILPFLEARCDIVVNHLDGFSPVELAWELAQVYPGRGTEVFFLQHDPFRLTVDFDGRPM